MYSKGVIRGTCPHYGTLCAVCYVRLRALWVERKEVGGEGWGGPGGMGGRVGCDGVWGGGGGYIFNQGFGILHDVSRL